MQTRRLLRCVLIYSLEMTLLGACLGCWGCSSPGGRAHPVEAGEAAARQELESAMEAFRKRDYAGAAVLFAQLSRRTSNQVMQRRALYGQACAMLAEARDEHEVREALNVWSKWQQLNPTRLDAEDPMMLSPFFAKLMVFEARVSAPHSPDDAKLEAMIFCRTLLDKKEKEIQQVRSRLESQNREAELLQKEIRKLKQQIESLEAIHREIQEKKREVSTQ
ncbi:hypothetical protein [Desulfoferrobacter suflitae]|uniref:hypothetical protein n=1 Tax=Desulfoferrobacter suflitae TaxID=2865782 RepID=UPI002164E6AB|nr:hypothetical protein [Desulfoferrobacter suflitae]MCK8601902.1 hypothetical protein [Desulfoferrobacter suflitae]